MLNGILSVFSKIKTIRELGAPGVIFLSVMEYFTMLYIYCISDNITMLKHRKYIKLLEF